eukprot:CAMPEP_0119362598 /NCGR_PEP_ID=MMETSP1334-20130426/9617_1 /TAXON_ID=127549 /ORGANISM="Calcidiscus leptoporus, Strain RCC1130" /LENGTH=62 /DNA_ID=CAMNT_0007377827 /DNA_START=646 /DNA_END=834 /DNA_ORIENTATION=+
MTASPGCDAWMADCVAVRRAFQSIAAGTFMSTAPRSVNAAGGVCPTQGNASRSKQGHASRGR